MRKIFVVGIGPGDVRHMTPAAEAAIEKSDVLCGYTVYLDLLGGAYPQKERITTGMTREMERCRIAVQKAQEGSHLTGGENAAVKEMKHRLQEMIEEYVIMMKQKGAESKSYEWW